MRLWERYLQPDNLDEALNALQSASGPAAVIAGGTDLLLDLEQGRHPAVHTLVDVCRISEMCAIDQRGEWIRIGAAAPLTELITHPLVRLHAAALTEACELIGGPQVRNVATLGGNVAHALPAGDGTIALLAMGAEAELSGPDGRRWLELEQLFDGPGRPTFDRSRQILVRFRLPASEPREGSAFRRVMRPQGVAIAILNLAVRLRMTADGVIDQIRLAIGPAGPRPLRARQAEAVLTGRALDPESRQAALQALEAEVSLRTSPHRATAEYRHHLLAGLLDGTLNAAVERAVRRGAGPSPATSGAAGAA